MLSGSKPWIWDVQMDWDAQVVVSMSLLHWIGTINLKIRGVPLEQQNWLEAKGSAWSRTVS